MSVRTRETNGYGSRLISVVSSAQDTKTDHYELEKIIKWIRTGEGRFSSVINEVRVAVAAGDKDRASDLKRRLPGVLFCGTFNKRRSSELIEASGMICMDFDGVENAASIIDRLRDDLYIIAAFVSPSGNGLKVILAIPQDPENHLRAFQAAKAYMYDMYGIEADDSGKDIARLCFLSMDSEAHYWPDAIELPIAPVVNEPKHHKAPGDSDRIGDRYMAAPDIRERSAAILTQAGWKIGNGNSSETHCTRPGKERGVSGTLRTDGSFYCFTDNAPPLEPSENYSAFSLLTTLEYSGDFKNATIALAEEFGDNEPTMSGRDFYGKDPFQDPSVPDDAPIEERKAAMISKLPEWTRGHEIPADLSKRIMQRYPVLIDGLLHRGTKMVLGGGSKSYKTWTLLNLAACVASGTPWFGRECVKTGKDVIFLNFEVPHEFFLQRVKSVCDAMGIEVPSNLCIWSLRGVCNDLRVILAALEEKVADDNLALICIDPIYKALGDRDENSAGDMGLLMNEVEALVERTGAAAAFGAHYSKGNQSEKDPLDRISGSGVFARDPDTIMGLTAHEEDNCFTVHAALRNFGGIEPFVVEWDFPLFRSRGDLDANRLRKHGQKVSASTVYKALVQRLPEGANPSDFNAEFSDEHGVTVRTVQRYIKELKDAKRVRITAGNIFAVIKDK